MTTLDTRIGTDAAPRMPGTPELASRSTPERLRRWVLVLAGLLFVGLAWIGVLVPGFPTTVFLILASWCFARSCPWLERRLLRNRVFGPLMRYVDRTEPMPRRAKIAAISVMWTFVALSVAILTLSSDAPAWVPIPVIAAAVVGTVTIRRW